MGYAPVLVCLRRSVLRAAVDVFPASHALRAGKLGKVGKGWAALLLGFSGSESLRTPRCRKKSSKSKDHPHRNNYKRK